MVDRIKRAPTRVDQARPQGCRRGSTRVRGDRQRHSSAGNISRFLPRTVGRAAMMLAGASIALAGPVQSLYFLPPNCDPLPMTNRPTQHVPVMANEVLSWLQPAAGHVLVDGTLGGGGHTRLLAEAVGPTGLVIAFDRDAEAVDIAAEQLRGLPVVVVHGNYADLPELLIERGTPTVDGILLDLGLSSDQLADDERGFSFHSVGPLDLRFDTSRGEPAWRLLERMSEEHLANLIFEWGEERYSRRIARQIVARRRQSPVRTAQDLAELIRSSVPRSRNDRIDPATRTFQALRIAVNEELKWLDVSLRRFPDCLRPGGRLAIISFHSLEDRRVKEAFRDDSRLDVLTRRPIRASEAEINSNPRSRSAKLRVAERKT